MPKISLCIELPTYNERENIEYMIKNIRKNYNYDIIVSDEHSSDGTAEIAKSLGVDVFPRKKPGYGEGVKESLIHAKERGHTHLLIMDCDRTYPIDYIGTLFKHAKEGYDLVNAGRRLSDIRLLNRLPNWFHTTLTNLLYKGKFKDVNSGMKLMNIDKYLEKFTASDCSSTAQTVIIALKNNYKTKEVTIPYSDRYGDKTKGKSKIRYRDGFIIMMRIFKDRF